MTKADENNVPPRKRVEVLCLTYGEPPENTWWVQTRYSLSILNRLTRRVAPLPLWLTPIIAAKRGRFRAKSFRAEKWSSPLEEISEQQVAALQKQLTKADPEHDYHVRLVLEFRPPYIWDHLRELQKNPPDEIVILPLYVADSDFTSGISRTDLEKYHAQTGGRHGLPGPRYVEGFGFDSRSGDVIARYIEEQCERAGWTEAKCQDSVLILGAHGTLIRPPLGINSGARETRYLFGMIRNRLRRRFRSIRIGWLNHVLGGVWTFPAVTETARESQESGIRKVVYLPFGFLADNGETQLEGKAQLGEFQWEDMLYLPCPNDNTALIQLLAQRVTERLAGPREDWSTIASGKSPFAYRGSPSIPAHVTWPGKESRGTEAASLA